MSAKRKKQPVCDVCGMDRLYILHRKTSIADGYWDVVMIQCGRQPKNGPPRGHTFNLPAHRYYRKRRSGAEGREVMSSGLTFDEFRTANVARCLKWHPQGIESWSPSDWLTAVTGELGELASLLKMRNRERDGLPGNKFSPTDRQIADEIADVFTYLDLLAAALGVDTGFAVARKFNEVSERVGFPDRIKTIAKETVA